MKLQTQKSVRDIYMHFVGNGQLCKIGGDKSKAEVTQAVHDAVMAFLKTRS
ncbi:MAG: hypothetical protein NWF04_09075 [Candidatus Bathyarchaeota archaeon]|nr:hypothetical protein [Candidatus Bathyarchaeota archaeon]